MLRTPVMVGAACSSRNRCGSTSRPNASYSFIAQSFEASPRFAPRAALPDAGRVFILAVGFPYFQKPFAVAAMARLRHLQQGQGEFVSALLTFPFPELAQIGVLQPLPF